MDKIHWTTERSTTEHVFFVVFLWSVNLVNFMNHATWPFDGSVLVLVASSFPQIFSIHFKIYWRLLLAYIISFLSLRRSNSATFVITWFKQVDKTLMRNFEVLKYIFDLCSPLLSYGKLVERWFHDPELLIQKLCPFKQNVFLTHPKLLLK